MELDLGRVRCFVEVAARGTVSAAADRLGYSGPAVSQQIAKLEKELGEKERAFKAARLAEDKAQERVKSLEH